MPVFLNRTFFHSSHPALQSPLSQTSSRRRSGKIPGRYLDGDWCGLTGQWAGVGLDAATSVAAKEWPTQNVGIRAASFPAIDIDTSTDDALRLVEEIVQRVAPEAATAPVRFRDGSPRALLFLPARSGVRPSAKGDGWHGLTRKGRLTRSIFSVSVSNMLSRVRTRPGSHMNGGMGETLMQSAPANCPS